MLYSTQAIYSAEFMLPKELLIFAASSSFAYVSSSIYLLFHLSFGMIYQLMHTYLLIHIFYGNLQEVSRIKPFYNSLYGYEYLHQVQPNKAGLKTSRM